jgi:hypothetical protein
MGVTHVVTIEEKTDTFLPATWQHVAAAYSA